MRFLGGPLFTIEYGIGFTIGKKEVCLSDQILQSPQEFLERLVRSNGDPFTDRNTDVVVVTCSDPRIADVIKNGNAQLIRLPGVEANPSWVGFRELMVRRPPLAMVFLCHDRCLAHNEVMGRAQAAVQKSRQDFWKHFGRAGGAWLTGRVDVESRHITFLSEDGEAWEPNKLLRAIPAHSGEALAPLLELNEKRRSAIIPRGTTPLHLPVGVLAISMAGALNDMRERNLAYVVDYVGQTLEAFINQVRTLGNVCLINVQRPHLVVVAPAEETDDARAILAYAMSVVSEMERGDHFTAELVARLSSGNFSSVARHNAIGVEAR